MTTNRYSNRGINEDAADTEDDRTEVSECEHVLPVVSGDSLVPTSPKPISLFAKI